MKIKNIYYTEMAHKIYFVKNLVSCSPKNADISTLKEKRQEKNVNYEEILFELFLGFNKLALKTLYSKLNKIFNVYLRL